MFSTGPHLDLKIKRNGAYINPLSYLQGKAGGGGAPNVKGGASAWRSVILKAASAMKESVTPAQVNGIIAQIQRESGGNQSIIQSSAVRDINTRNGNPARGLLQYIPQTFKSYAVKGHNNIYSGYDQLLAFFNNKSWRSDLPYGRRGWGPRGARKYKNGTGSSGHPFGDAIMGDGGKNEPFLLPNGQLGLSPNIPTLFPDLPKGTVVWSSLKDFFKQYNPFPKPKGKGDEGSDNGPSGSDSPPGNEFNDTPSISSSQKSIVYSPTITIQVTGKDNEQDIEAKFKQMLDEHYKKLNELMFGDE